MRDGNTFQVTSEQYMPQGKPTTFVSGRSKQYNWCEPSILPSLCTHRGTQRRQTTKLLNII